MIFTVKLEAEREQFWKSIDQYKQHFEKIKKFNDLSAITEYSADAFTLKENLTNAFEKVK